MLHIAKSVAVAKHIHMSSLIVYIDSAMSCQAALDAGVTDIQVEGDCSTVVFQVCQILSYRFCGLSPSKRAVRSSHLQIPRAFAGNSMELAQNE